MGNEEVKSPNGRQEDHQNNQRERISTNFGDFCFRNVLPQGSWMPLREDLYGRTAWSMDMGLAMALEPISMYTRVLHRATVCS